MDRRQFSKNSILISMGVLSSAAPTHAERSENIYTEPPKDLPVRTVDVVVAGAGTAGVAVCGACASWRLLVRPTRLKSVTQRRCTAAIEPRRDCLRRNLARIGFTGNEWDSAAQLRDHRQVR